MDASQDGNKRATILVVDDTPDSLVVIADILKSKYRVKIANSGAKALDIMQSDPPPDLILLDIIMPEMDGYEVCQRVKANHRTQDVPIIFLTAKSDIEDERKGLELGAVDYIPKPVSPPILLARVNTQLNLKASYDNLRNLLTFREDMVNMIVHDLRNPLSNILLMAEMLEENPHLPPEKIAKNSSIILRSGKQLRFLVDDLLIKAKLEANKLVLDRRDTNLWELVESAIADLKEIADRKNLHLCLTSPEPDHPPFSLDPVLFRRAIDNLLSNAIKFSPSDSQITLTIEYPNVKGVRVMVADLGQGVSQELRQTIFEKYEIGTLVKDVKQTGLGLAFSKIVIEGHGGTITVTDNQPQGSIFTVEINNFNGK